MPAHDDLDSYEEVLTPEEHVALNSSLPKEKSCEQKEKVEQPQAPVLSANPSPKQIEIYNQQMKMFKLKMRAYEEKKSKPEKSTTIPQTKANSSDVVDINVPKQKTPDKDAAAIRAVMDRRF